MEVEVKAIVNGEISNTISYVISGDDAEVKAFLNSIGGGSGPSPDPVDPTPDPDPSDFTVPYYVKNGDRIIDIDGAENYEVNESNYDFRQCSVLGVGDDAGLMSGAYNNWAYTFPLTHITSYDGFMMSYGGTWLCGEEGTFYQWFDSCTDLHSAFRSIYNTNDKVLKLYNTDKVTNWDATFYDSPYIVKINEWYDPLKMDSATEIGNMFTSNDSLEEVWITNLPADKVEQMESMLRDNCPNIKEECIPFMKICEVYIN